MKIIISISMSFLFFFQGIAANMEICEQIEEISHFVEHFKDHKQDDGYSFIDYVYQDYIKDDGKLDNHHPNPDHENAPVHTNHQCCLHFVFFTPFQPTSISPIFSESQNQYNSYNFQLNSRYLESLFQPPQV